MWAAVDRCRSLCEGRPRTSGDTPLIAAVSNGNKECVTRLLAARALTNKMNPSGQTPLMRSVANGNLDLVNILLKAGADVKGDPEDPPVTLLILAVSDGIKECKECVNVY